MNIYRERECELVGKFTWIGGETLNKDKDDNLRTYVKLEPPCVLCVQGR